MPVQLNSFIPPISPIFLSVYPRELTKAELQIESDLLQIKSSIAVAGRYRMKIQLIDHVIWEPIQSIFPFVIVTCDFILLKNLLIRRSQAGQQQSVRRVHVDTTQLDHNHKFELSVVQPPNDHNADESTKYYQLKQLEHFAQDVEVIF